MTRIDSPRHARRPASPFGDVKPAAAAAGVFAAVGVVWLVAGPWLPGDRWVAVHLFTLGVLTNVVIAFTRHFGDTLTRSDADGSDRWILVTFNLSAVMVMVGVVTGRPIVVGVASTAATVAVLGNYRHLRRSRRSAIGARFAWIVRAYERAHGAFVHGAILGGLLGAGVLTGAWYGSARLAHLHVNVLGWAGITLLATLVFFGPTMARTRIEPGADDRAARMVRVGAHGVTIAALLLLASGFADGLGMLTRALAAVALAVFAGAATSTCLAVARAVRGAKPGAARWPVIAVCAWFIVATWMDVAVVATGAWRLLDSVGLAMLVGVLVQAVATSLAYVTPMLVARTRGEREPLRLALERVATGRAVVFNLGVVIVVVLALVGPQAATTGAIAATVGWTLVILALGQPVAAVLATRAASHPEGHE